MSHLTSNMTQIDGSGLKTTYDCQNDSGFLSGSNLLSSSSLTDESSKNDPPHPTAREPSMLNSEYENKSSRQTEALDSGIDITDQLSSLNLTSSGPIVPPPPPQADDVPSQESPLRNTRSGLTPVEVAFLQEVFKADEDGDTQLHVAVMGGFVEAVWNITRILPHQAFLDLPNHTGRTALHLAVAAGVSKIARHLLVCGSSPVMRDCRGNTPLHVACSIRDTKMVSELTRPVTEQEVLSSRLNYPPKHIAGLLAADLGNYDGQTCIHIAAQCGNMEILQHLFWCGADINAKEAKCGRTALHYAVEQRDRNLVTFLYKSCRADLSVETYAGLNPYQLALANDAPEIATLLGEFQGDMMPYRLSQEEDDEENPESEKRPWCNPVDDLRIGGVPLNSALPVSTAGPLNCDFYV